MAHRRKHRSAALIRRVEQGRMIKSDVDNPEYKLHVTFRKRSEAARKGAATRRAKKSNVTASG